MKRLIWVRHGETSWNREFRLQGASEVPLSELGIWQAGRLAAALPGPVHRVFVSPLGRAQSFAHPLTTKFALAAETLDELREMSFGRWEGQSYADMDPCDKRAFLAWGTDPAANSPPGGEEMEAFACRVAVATGRMVEALEDNMTAVAVTHGGVIRVAVALLLGMPLASAARLQIDLASASVTETAGGAWKLVRLNETCHLCAFAPNCQ